MMLGIFFLGDVHGISFRLLFWLIGFMGHLAHSIWGLSILGLIPHGTPAPIIYTLMERKRLD